MLADRPQNSNHRLLSHTIFDDESRKSLYFLVVVPANSIYFFDTLALQQHYQKHGHSHHSCTGLLWTHGTNSTRYRCWWFQSWCLCANMLGRRRWSGVSLGHRPGCLERCSAATKHLWTVRIKTQRRVHMISTTLVLDAEIKLIMLLIWRMARSFLSVFNTCPRSPWVRMLLWQTRRMTFIWHLVTLEYFLTSPSEKDQDLRTEQYFQYLQAVYCLAWLPLWFEMIICV